MAIKNRNNLDKVEVAKPKTVGQDKTDYKNFLAKHFTINGTENNNLSST